MSYILDALRRADSERERGGVPGLHTRPMATADREARPQRSGPPWAWLAAGLAGGLAVALGWMLLGRDAPEVPVAAAPPPLPVGPAPAAPPAPAPMPAVAAQPLAAQTAPPAAPPVAAPGPLPAPVERHAAALPRATQRPAVKAATAASASRPAASAAPVEQPRIYALKDLPEEVRRDLPALAIGGSIYSESQANRFVIINGQLFHENDVLAPGLTLRNIRLKSAVLEFRGYRYEIGY